MVLSFQANGQDLQAEISKGRSIGISVKESNTISAWGLENARYIPYSSDEFTGSVRLGGPCNVDTISFVPHTNGTHTECFGHITEERYSVLDYVQDDFYYAKLVSLDVNDSDTHKNSLDFSNISFDQLEKYKAIIIRSLPNNSHKQRKDYLHTNPPYISSNDMLSLRESGIEHLVIDLPSVDPESDNGALLAHKAFWNLPSQNRKSCSITEFVYIPDDISDGDYLLKLNIAPFQSDASPSSPMLYPIVTH